MKKIKIAGVEIEYLMIYEREVQYNGAYRRGLTITCPEDAIGLDALNDLLVEQNLDSIVAINEDAAVTDYYDGFVIKMSCGVVKTLVEPENADHPNIYEDRIVFEVGKRTYTEEQLSKIGL